MEPRPGALTQLLISWQEGDESAKEKLFAALYEDLRQIAREQRDQWQGNHTLNTTALLHELYLKLSRQGMVRAEDRGQFNRFVARALRRILMDYARDQRSQRRGGAVIKISLDTFRENTVVPLDGQVEALSMMDEALSKLAALDARLSDVVELWFYGGFTHEEIAMSLGISKRTVTRDWARARMWLRRILRELDGQHDHAR